MAEKIGFDHAVVAIIDPDTEEVVTGDKGLSENGLFTINSKTSKGTISGQISGLEPTSKKVYGSNQLVDVIAQGVGNAALTLTANDIPQDILDKLAGMEKDPASGAWYIDNNTSAPYAAVALVSQDSKGNPIYLALYKGKFGPEEVKLQTNTNQTQMATDSVKFSAINRNSDNRVYGRYTVDGTTVTEDKVLADIFRGYKAAASSPSSNVH